MPRPIGGALENGAPRAQVPTHGTTTSDGPCLDVVAACPRGGLRAEGDSYRRDAIEPAGLPQSPVLGLGGDARRGRCGLRGLHREDLQEPAAPGSSQRPLIPPARRGMGPRLLEIPTMARRTKGQYSPSL